MSRLFWMLSLAVVAGATVPVKAQSSLEISDLRQRISAIEQQLFQARMNSGPQYPAIDQLQARVSQIERDIAAQRISDTTNAVIASGQRRAAAPDTMASLQSKIAALEAQQQKDSATIAALTKRIAALERPAQKPRRR